MRLGTLLLVSLLAPSLVACDDGGGGDPADTSSTTDTAIADDGDTAVAGDTSVTADTSVTDDTAVAGDTSAASDTAVAGDTSAAGDTSGTGDTTQAPSYDAWDGVTLLDDNMKLYGIDFTADGHIVLVGSRAHDAGLPNGVPTAAWARVMDGAGQVLMTAQKGSSSARAVLVASDGGIYVAAGTLSNQNHADRPLAIYELTEVNGEATLVGVGHFSAADLDDQVAYASWNTPTSLFEFANGDLGMTINSQPGAPDDYLPVLLLHRMGTDGSSVATTMIGAGTGAHAGGAALAGDGHIFGCTTAPTPFGDLVTPVGKRDIGLMKAAVSDLSSPTGLLVVGTGEDDFCHGVVSADDGGIFIAGSSLGALYGNGGQGRDIIVARYSAGLDKVWGVQSDKPGMDYASGIIRGDDGHLYVFGNAERDGNQAKAWVASYTVDGAERWSKTYGSGLNLPNPQGAATHDGDLFVVGYFVPAHGVDSAFEGVTVSSSEAGFVLRLDTSDGSIR